MVTSPCSKLEKLNKNSSPIHSFFKLLTSSLINQAVLDTVHVTVFDQSYVVSAGAMADTFFVANGE